MSGKKKLHERRESREKNEKYGISLRKRKTNFSAKYYFAQNVGGRRGAGLKNDVYSFDKITNGWKNGKRQREASRRDPEREGERWSATRRERQRASSGKVKIQTVKVFSTNFFFSTRFLLSLLCFPPPRAAAPLPATAAAASRQVAFASAARHRIISSPHASTRGTTHIQVSQKQITDRRLLRSSQFYTANATEISLVWTLKTFLRAENGTYSDYFWYFEINFEKLRKLIFIK